LLVVPAIFRFSAPAFSLFGLLLPVTATASGTPDPGISAGTFMQTLLALGLIVALLGGTAWLARKVSGGKGFGRGGMRVVGGVALGPKERIILVEVGEQWLVIGIVPSQIRTLHRLPKGAAIPDEIGAPASDRPFAQWLKQTMERRSDA
jgi:flagellar protein FliO/FliZ